jgi:hypothetical protein
MSAPPFHRPRPRRARRLLLFLLAAAAWTLLSSYPNPAVFFRSVARYLRLPIDPGLEARADWDLPDDPASIELFVDGLLVPTPDWRLYRVPWYMPTAQEAAPALHGDCEAKAVIFASLLAGKNIPFQVRASFSHIWVDYPGRPTRRGEEREVAYLEGDRGRLRLRLPRTLRPWQTLIVQREQLWDPMPLARKALWLVGLLWVGLGALLLGGPAPTAELASRWRPGGRAYLARSAWFFALTLALIVIAPALRAGQPVRWTLADLWEALALCAVAGAFAAWLSFIHARRAVSIGANGEQIELITCLGLWRRTRTFTSDDVARFELEASAGGPRPWLVRAVLRTGERVELLRRRGEIAARTDLRRLASALSKPLLVRSNGHESHTMPDELSLNLRQRAARRPAPDPIARPHTCDLETEESPGRWVLRYPLVQRRGGPVLLGCAAFAVLLAALATVLLLRFPLTVFTWLGWLLAASILSLAIYLAIILRPEMMARLSGARVEVGEGKLRFHGPEGKVEAVKLDAIEAVEIARQGETPTIAVISRHRVIHLRGLHTPKEAAWLRQAVEQAILLKSD